MDFKEQISKAKNGNRQDMELLWEQYKPLLLKESIVRGIFDEDLYQELCFTFLKCVRKFEL